MFSANHCLKSTQSRYHAGAAIRAETSEQNRNRARSEDRMVGERSHRTYTGTYDVNLQGREFCKSSSPRQNRDDPPNNGKPRPVTSADETSARAGAPHRRSERTDDGKLDTKSQNDANFIYFKFLLH